MARIAACRKPTGAPATVTTRRPSTALADGLAVARCVSRIAGIAEDHEEDQEGDDDDADPASGEMREVRRPTAPRPSKRHDAQAERQVEEVARTRDPSVASRNSRTTASGVTMPGTAGRCTPRRRPRTDTDGLVDIDRSSPSTTATGSDSRTLTKRARKTRSMSATELDELVSLYQRTSAQLSVARTTFNDPALNARLTRLVGDTNTVIYGTPAAHLRALRRFFTGLVSCRRVARPLVRARRRPRSCSSPRSSIGTWLRTRRAAVEAAAPQQCERRYVNRGLRVRTTRPSLRRSSRPRCSINNIQVVDLRVRRRGILLCGVTAYILVTNGSERRRSRGAVRRRGSVAGKFFGTDPPPRPARALRRGHRGRGQGCGSDGRSSTPVTEPARRAGRARPEVGRDRARPDRLFAVAGTIEGFVTGSGLPTFFRVGLGVVVASAFWLYIVTQGRIAAANGFTGLLSEEDAAIRTKRVAPTLVTA